MVSIKGYFLLSMDQENMDGPYMSKEVIAARFHRTPEEVVDYLKSFGILLLHLKHRVPPV